MTTTAIRIAEDAVSYCHRREAGRARNITAQASAVRRANQDASALWAQAADEWQRIGMTEQAQACAELAGPEFFKAAAE